MDEAIKRMTMETDDKEKGWGMDQKRCGTDKSGKG